MIGLLQLAAADIEQAKAIIEEAKQQDVFGQDFAPRVQIVDKNHWAFRTPAKAKRLAMAARDEDGGEWVLINRDAPPKDIRPIMQHEISHLAAWRRYGEQIKEHGPQFQRECRQMVQTRPNYFCKGFYE